MSGLKKNIYWNLFFHFMGHRLEVGRFFILG